MTGGLMSRLVRWTMVLATRYGHYYCTSCLHGQHQHCRSGINIDGGDKTPGTCKWCTARCVCGCR